MLPCSDNGVVINCSRSAHHQREVVRLCVERLLAQLQYSFDQLKFLEEEDRRRQDELDIKCLQIMRAIIHNEIVNIDPNLKENSASGYRKRCISRVQPIQNSIQDRGNAVSRVVPLLSHPNDEIVREVLAFLKAMLYSGNRHVQEGLNTVFDTREERLFTTMAGLLQNAAITFKEKYCHILSVNYLLLLMLFCVFRRSLLSQVEARSISEALLKANPLALISAQESGQPPTANVDIAINIEVSTNGSPYKAGEATTSFIPLEESSVKEKEFTGSQVLESDRKASPLNRSPKQHRRHSQKPAGTQLFKLEVS